jgi:hypothetical protein
MPDKRRDVFISHASEDKLTVVEPLVARRLIAAARAAFEQRANRISGLLAGLLDLASDGTLTRSPRKSWPPCSLCTSTGLW